MSEVQFTRALNPSAELNATESRAANDAYADFLRESDQSTSGDLLRYFGRDFFHDGSMSAVVVDADTASFSFRTKCENVQRPDRMSVQPAPQFDVRFENVVEFAWASGRPGQRIFVGAEIDGLPDSISDAEARHSTKFHSLVIDAYGESFQVVFTAVRVNPTDPVSWTSILADPELQVLGLFE